MNKKTIRTTVNTICREPYRLFFPLGIWMGVVGLTPWLFYAFGLSATYSGFFHSSVQMLVYMNCFVVGFLTTFIPRFTKTGYATRPEVSGFLFVLLGIVIFLRRELWIAAEACYLLWLTLLLVFIFRRIKSMSRERAGGNPPVEMIWMGIAVIHGYAGTGLLILSQLGIQSAVFAGVGKPMMEQGFLLSVVIGIGGFLIPRLMGTYVKAEDPNDEDGSKRTEIKKNAQSLGISSRITVHLVCALLMFMSFWLEGLGYLAWGYGMRALGITVVFSLTRIFPKINLSSVLYIKMAWVSAWCVALGYWLAAVMSDYSVAMLHIAFIGGFSLMTFAIGTMVVMSHAGAAELLQKSLWILWVVVLGILFAALKRVVIVFMPEHYFSFLGIASVIWIVIALCWLGYLTPYFLKVPLRDEFEKMHEEAKKRLNGDEKMT